MNEDESTYEVPDYILSRLQPTLTLGFPERDDEMEILKYHLPFAEQELLALTVEFLRNSPVLLFPEPLEYTIVGISARS